MDYPLNELIDMIYVLGETGKNPLLAQRIYRMKYPERRIPTAVGAANEDNELEILLNI